MVRSKVNVFVDLYRQRQALLAMQAELERAVRMRDDFMSMVSHELRTPLNTLFLEAQLRKRQIAGGQLPDAAACEQMVERDERQIRSMIRLIDDMLDVSRAAHRQAVDGPATDGPGRPGAALRRGHAGPGARGRRDAVAGRAGAAAGRRATSSASSRW